MNICFARSKSALILQGGVSDGQNSSRGSACSISGQPIPAAIFFAASTSSGSGSLAGITGTPTDWASLRADTLSPSFTMVSGDGPMKAMPAAAQAAGKSGFSDNRP